MDKLNNPFKVMSFIIEKADFEELRQLAFDKRKSIGATIRDAVKSLLKENGRENVS